MQTVAPPFDKVSPATPVATSVTGYWYPVVVEEAHVNDGRLELGAIATHEYGELKVWGLAISDAEASVTLHGIVSPSGYRGPNVTVTAQVAVDGEAQGWAPVGKMARGTVVLDLDVTIIEPGPNGYVKTPHYASKTVYFKEVLTGGAFVDPITGQHELVSKFTVSEPTASLFIATVTARATAIASLNPEITGGMQCPAVVIDLEGYDKPKGIYYPKGGSILVSGFAIASCK